MKTNLIFSRKQRPLGMPFGRCDWDGISLLSYIWEAGFQDKPNYPHRINASSIMVSGMPGHAAGLVCRSQLLVLFSARCTGSA